ncbi:MAG: lipopolysaccharide heptosyltransferase II [Candidatus Omnitrophica bacterium]|nr:lipopolysaccharide heptosyltransferase II [Candidatus Omnitrophota bacterium]MCF7893536.1 lipopolysaccharide heptosyltransferase II [Candidatus Omnitrophota bacterium]
MKKQLKILLVEPNWLGDVILTTPAFKAIKEVYPKSFLAVVVARKAAPILENNPHIDKIFKLDEKKEERTIFSKIKFIKKIRTYQFDKAFLLHRSFTKTLLVFLAKTKEIIGYNYKKRSLLLSKKIPVINKDSVHKQDYYLNILKISGINIDNKNCQVYLGKAEEKNLEKILPQANHLNGNYLIGINPHSNWPPKDWPLSNYQKLIKKILNKYPNSTFFITSKNKQKNIPAIFTQFGKKVIDLSGKTNLRQLACLYSQLDLVISGDSGPLHLAGAVGTKFIAIFGPTSPSCTKPINRTKGYLLFENDICPVPCYQKNCPKNHQCMLKITPQTVAKTTLALLTKRGRSF